MGYGARARELWRDPQGRLSWLFASSLAACAGENAGPPVPGEQGRSGPPALGGTGSVGSPRVASSDGAGVPAAGAAGGSVGAGGSGASGNGGSPDANAAPHVADAQYAVAATGMARVSSERGLLQNATDPDGDELRVASAGTDTAVPADGAQVALVTELGGELTLRANGSFEYVPPPGAATLEDAVPFSVTDGRGGVAAARVVFGIVPGETEWGFEIAGLREQEFLAGSTVARLGDVNGDGLGDVIVVARASARDVGYVVFGSTEPRDVQLGPDFDGPRIIGQTAELEDLGVAVSAAGRVNDDRFDDFIIGVHQEPIGPAASARLGGKAYVIFGSARWPAEIHLATLEAEQRGFVIIGAAGQDHLGFSVAGAGDVNGAGGDDLVLGAIGAFPTSGRLPTDGKAYVVFGKDSFTPVNLASLGEGGFLLTGEAGAAGEAGVAVSGVGDWNADGKSDIAVSATKLNDAAGRIYIVYGKADTGVVRLSDVANGEGGFAIDATAENEQAGRTLANGGDLGGSSLPDLVIGAPNPPGSSVRGKTYVVYGHSRGDRLSLGAIDRGGLALGFVVRAEAAGDRSGLSVSGIGDFNADGWDDLLIGASEVGEGRDGAAYVLFGSAALRQGIDVLGVPANRGLTWRGDPNSEAHFGFSVSGAGDMNGDAYPDIIIGAPREDAFTGRARVRFGGP